MLLTKKKDTNTGFDELAESNKELRSLKSGDLFRDRSMAFSRASQRSKHIIKGGHPSSQYTVNVDDISSSKLGRSHNFANGNGNGFGAGGVGNG